MSRLVVAYPGTIPEVDGHLMMDEKLRSGVANYQRRWPGHDVVLAATTRASAGADTGAGTRTVKRSELGFELVTGHDWAAATRRSTGDLILAPMVASFDALADLVDRTVLVAEFTPEDLARNERRSAASPTGRARIRVGSHRRRRNFETWAKAARGVQCNGYPAFDHFSDLAASSLLFFDTRLTSDHVDAARHTRRSTTQAPPRLCFSGRLIEAKGPRYALDVVELLRSGGVETELVVFGGGALTAALRSRDVPGVYFRGVVDFASEWTKYVREEVDVMVLPHTQGDPSGTYLEAAGCGVPVLGFDNVALGSLVDHHGVGAVAPMRDVRALAGLVSEFLSNDERRTSASTAGLDFMAGHHADAEFDRRISHLLSCL